MVYVANIIFLLLKMGNMWVPEHSENNALIIALPMFKTNQMRKI